MSKSFDMFDRVLWSSEWNYHGEGLLLVWVATDVSTTLAEVNSLLDSDNFFPWGCRNIGHHHWKQSSPMRNSVTRTIRDCVIKCYHCLQTRYCESKSNISKMRCIRSRSLYVWRWRVSRFWGLEQQRREGNGKKKRPARGLGPDWKRTLQNGQLHGWFVLFISLTERSREGIRVRAWEKIQDDNFSLQTSGVW